MQGQKYIITFQDWYQYVKTLLVNPHGNIVDMYVLINIFTVKSCLGDVFLMGESNDFNPCCCYSVLVNRESEGPEYCIDCGFVRR